MDQKTTEQSILSNCYRLVLKDQGHKYSVYVSADNLKQAVQKASEECGEFELISAVCIGAAVLVK